MESILNRPGVFLFRCLRRPDRPAMAGTELTERVVFTR